MKSVVRIALVGGAVLLVLVVAHYGLEAAAGGEGSVGRWAASSCAGCH